MNPMYYVTLVSLPGSQRMKRHGGFESHLRGLILKQNWEVGEV